MKLITFIDRQFDKILQDRYKYIVETLFGITALVAFIVHIILIALAKAELITSEILRNSSFVAAILTPFALIVIYEILELALTFRSSLFTYLLLQFQVISLLLVRDVFKYFAEGNNATQNISGQDLLEITLTLFTAGLLFIFIFYARKSKNCFVEIIQESAVTMRLRKYISLVLVIGIVVALISYLFSFTTEELGEYIASGFQLYPFFTAAFTLMILADTFLFILSFIVDDRYVDLFTSSALLIAAILVRAAITVDTPAKYLLVIIGLAVTMLMVEFAKRTQSKPQI